MEYREFAAPAPLGHLVHAVWFLRGAAGAGAPQPVVPDGRIELVAHLGEPFSRLGADGRAVRQPDFIISGQLTRPLTLLPAGDIHVVGIRLEPRGAHLLLGLPLDEITDQVVPLGEVDPRLRAALLPSVTVRGALGERADAIFDALARRLAGARESGIGRALAAMETGAPVRVDALAREAGMPERTLQRRFRAEVGLGPKVYQRVLRFRRAFALVSAAPGDGLAAAAHRAGYYDQAHLNRDFRRFAGAPPREFFRADPALAQAFASGERGHAT
jgi:AraC-like DNA-binding protein